MCIRDRAGDDLARRLAVFRLFDEDAVLRRSGLIRIETEATGEPALAAAELEFEPARAAAPQAAGKRVGQLRRQLQHLSLIHI